VLYVENNAASHAFTRDRTQVLDVLAGQFAVAVENARLYGNIQRLNADLAALNRELEGHVERRTRELRDAQAKLVALERDATEARMAGGFAHEMRNALAAAKQYLAQALPTPARPESVPERAARAVEQLVELVPEGGALDAATRAEFTDHAHALVEAQETLQHVVVGAHRAVVRALDITRRILAYSRVGRRGDVEERADLGHAVRSVGTDLGARAAQLGAALVVDAGAGCLVPLSELDAFSVVQNLAQNALDALQERAEEGPGSLAIRAEVSGDATVLVVEDTGAGIAPEHRARVYDAFFSTKPETGTGLGLALVHKIVISHGGTIDFESERGRGTTFTVRLPRPAS